MRWGTIWGPWRCMAGTVPSGQGSGCVIKGGGLQEAGEKKKKEGEGSLEWHCLGPESGLRQEATVLGVRSAKESLNSHSARGSNEEEEEKRRGREDNKRKGSRAGAARLARHKVRRRVRMRRITRGVWGF